MSKRDRRVGYVYDPAMTLHQALDDHPECPGRIQRIYQALLNKGLIDRMIAVKSREISLDELSAAHDKNYLDTLEWKLRAPKGVRKQLEDQYNSIYVNEHTLMCAKLAAGSVLELATKVATGEMDSGAAIVRPPGHHATRDSAMGFCIYSNVAVAAKNIKKIVKRILIVDWDIHHGNGTQNIVKNDEQILFFSVHRYDGGEFYPQTGHSGNSVPDNIINVGLNGHIGDEEYLNALIKYLLPAAKIFSPDIILISAGFDALKDDPLGKSTVTPEGFYQFTKLLKKICPKIVLVLEGGYHLNNMAEAFSKCTEALLKND